MEASSELGAVNRPVRSISLPTRLQPHSLTIEEELKKLRIVWESPQTAPSGSEELQMGLLSLAELYSSVQELIFSPITQKSLLKHENGRLIEESDGLLDACSTSRDLLFAMEENLQNLQSALRRKGVANSSVEIDISAYNLFRKKMKKSIGKQLKALKRIVPEGVADDHHLFDVRLLREVSRVAVIIFRSFFLFLSVPVMKTKAGGWLKMINVGALGFGLERGERTVNEVGSVDAALFALHGSVSKKEGRKDDVQMVLKKLDGCIEVLQERLDYLFKRLIQYRVSLLNILAQY